MALLFGVCVYAGRTKRQIIAIQRLSIRPHIETILGGRAMVDERGGDESQIGGIIFALSRVYRLIDNRQAYSATPIPLL